MICRRNLNNQGDCHVKRKLDFTGHLEVVGGGVKQEGLAVGRNPMAPKTQDQPCLVNYSPEPSGLVNG
jgi:hypothetical protein